MNILVVSGSYPPFTSGVSTVAGSISMAMASRGHNVGVICPSYSLESSKMIVNNVLEFRLKSFPNPFRTGHRIILPAFSEVEKIVNNFKPNIIHLHDPAYISNYTINLANNNKIPTLYTHHFIPRYLTSYMKGFIPGLHIFSKLDKIEALTSYYMKKFSNKCSRIITPTFTIKKYLINLGVIKPIEAISNGINIKHFHNGVRKSMQEVPTLLYFGRLDKDKSLEVLIKAMGEVKKICKLIIAGDGDENDKLRNLTVKLHLEKKIYFTGYVNEKDVPDLYKNADLFVIPSTVEAQSIVTMQALASGLPVIASDSAALPELVHDGENGYLFMPEDYKNMAVKIDELIGHKNNISKFSAASLKIISKHNIEDTFKKYEKEYFDLISSLS